MLWTASTIWAQKNAIFEHYTHYPKLWMEQSISRITERSNQMTGRGDTKTDSRVTELIIFSTLQWSQQKERAISTLQQFSLYRPWPICLGKDLFWRILMYTSRQDLPFTNKCRLKLHPVSAIYKRFLSIQVRSQAVAFRSRLYSERLVCQKLDSWYC